MVSRTHLLRCALMEAIESVEVVIDSNHVPNKKLLTDSDKHLEKKWRTRLCVYRELLVELGGPVHGELTAAEDYNAAERTAAS